MLSEFPAYRIIADECGFRVLNIARVVTDQFICMIVQHMRNWRSHLSKVVTSYADESHIKHVLLLSATPTPTHLNDLWTPMRMIGVSPAFGE